MKNSKHKRYNIFEKVCTNLNNLTSCRANLNIYNLKKLVGIFKVWGFLMFNNVYAFLFN